MELSSDSIFIRGLLNSRPGQLLDSFHSPVLSLFFFLFCLVGFLFGFLFILWFLLFCFASLGNNHYIALFLNSAVRKMKLLSSLEIEMLK